MVIGRTNTKNHGVEATTTNSVDNTCRQQCRNTIRTIGITVSTVSTSLLQRLRIRPSGVESKKVIGRRTTALERAE